MPYKDREQNLACQRHYRETHREELRAEARAYAAQRREAKRLYDVEYRKKNKESICLKRREYDQRNKERIKPRKALYALLNPEIGKNARKRYRSTHPEVGLACRERRRARMANTPVNDFSTKQWKLIKFAYSYCCAYCGKKQERLAQDHVIPLRNIGWHTASNIVPSCKYCNSKKGTKLAPPLVCNHMVVTECP